MSYDPNKRRYEDDTVDKKKKLTREDFKKDITEAIKKGIKKPPKKRAPRAKAGAYGNMSVAELRAFLNDKKKRLLTKSGFPNGALPRSKAAMIQLCKALKRKRW